MKKIALIAVLFIFMFSSLSHAQAYQIARFLPLSFDGFEKWVYPLGINDGFSSPAIGSDGTVYVVGSQDGCLNAVNPDGSLKWSFPIGAGWNQRSSPAIAADGTIYVGSANGTFYAIAPDGLEKWHYRTYYAGFTFGGFDVQGAIYSSPAIASDGTIYFAADDGFIYALDQHGTLKGTYPAYKMEKKRSARVSIAVGQDGTVFLVNATVLYALTPDLSMLKWTYPGIRENAPAINYDGTIYVGGSNNSILAISPSGGLKQEYSLLKYLPNCTSASVSAPITIGPDGSIYAGILAKSFAGPLEGKVVAFRPDGSLKFLTTLSTNAFWCGSNEPWSAPTIGKDGTVFVTGNYKMLHAISPDGKIKWSYDTRSDCKSYPKGNYASPAIAPDGTVYILFNGLRAIYTTSGGLAGSAWPMFQQNPKHTAQAVKLMIAPIRPPVIKILR